MITPDYSNAIMHGSRLTVLMDGVLLPCTIFYILNKKRD